MKKTKGFAKAFKAAGNPAIILGTGALNRADTPQILAAVSGLAKKVNLVHEGWNGLNILHTAEGWNGLNILHTAASRVAGLDMGFLPGEGGLSTHEILDAAQQGAVKTVFLMGADELDTSKLKDAFVIYQKGEAKEDWAIIRALSGHLNRVLPYDNLGALREKLFADHPTFAGLGYAPGATDATEFDISALGESGNDDVSYSILVRPITMGMVRD